jgi:hypothetical protein
MLVCKHCGEDFCIGKGYFGSYVTVNEAMFEQLNDFFKKHEYGCCSNDTDCSDNARNHFAILEEGEDLDVLTAEVVPRAEVAREIDDIKRYILLNEDIAIKCKQENGEQNEEYWKGKVSAFRQIRAYIDAELKKKYTEGQK